MYRTALLPVSFSKTSVRAIARATELFTTDTTFHLYHAIEPIGQVDQDELGDFYADLWARVERDLARTSAELIAAGYRVFREITIEKPVPGIIRCAAQREVDVIVLASHALDPGQPGGGIGTVSHHIAIGATCDVLLVR